MANEYGRANKGVAIFCFKKLLNRLRIIQTSEEVVKIHAIQVDVGGA